VQANCAGHAVRFNSSPPDLVDVQHFFWDVDVPASMCICACECVYACRQVHWCSWQMVAEVSGACVAVCAACVACCVVPATSCSDNSVLLLLLFLLLAAAAVVAAATGALCQSHLSVLTSCWIRPMGNSGARSSAAHVGQREQQPGGLVRALT
jgi:hypothetical protein